MVRLWKLEGARRGPEKGYPWRSFWLNLSKMTRTREAVACCLEISLALAPALIPSTDAPSWLWRAAVQAEESLAGPQRVREYGIWAVILKMVVSHVYTVHGQNDPPGGAVELLPPSEEAEHATTLYTHIHKTCTYSHSHTFTHIHSHMLLQTFTHIYSCLSLHWQSCTHVYSHTRSDMHPLSHTHTCIHIHTCSNIDSFIHILAHILTHMLTHSDTCTYIPTCTHSNSYFYVQTCKNNHTLATHALIYPHIL